MLHEFAEDTPWVHLDIAPTYRSDRDRGPLVKGVVCRHRAVLMQQWAAFQQELGLEDLVQVNC